MRAARGRWRFGRAAAIEKTIPNHPASVASGLCGAEPMGGPAARAALSYLRQIRASAHLHICIWLIGKPMSARATVQRTLRACADRARDVLVTIGMRRYPTIFP